MGTFSDAMANKSGGKNSGIYKSSDGGETWIKLKGLPKSLENLVFLSLELIQFSLCYFEAEGEKVDYTNQMTRGKLEINKQ